MHAATINRNSCQGLGRTLYRKILLVYIANKLCLLILLSLSGFKCQGPATMVKLQCPQQPRQTMWRRTMGSHHNWLRDEGRVLVHGTRTFLFSTQEEDTGIYEAWTVEKPQRVMCRMYLIIAEGELSCLGTHSLCTDIHTDRQTSG